MNKVKFYALCSRNMHAMKRHLNTVQREDLYIVINTQDEAFKKDAVHWCEHNNVPYQVSESDGTPATGKNSVLDIFLESDNDYAVMIDGDDFVTKHGVETYKMIANMDDAPDVVALEMQYGIAAYEMIASDEGIKTVPKRPAPKDKNPNAIPGAGCKPFLRNEEWWKKYSADNTNCPEAYKRWVKQGKKYISGRETHLRVPFISRKAAEMFRFDKDFIVGEDTLMYLNYKDAYVHNELKMRHMIERLPTYVYDTRVAGIVEEETSNGEFSKDPTTLWATVEWVSRLADKFEEYERDGIMHEIEVPRLEVEYPEDYEPNIEGVLR